MLLQDISLSGHRGSLDSSKVWPSGPVNYVVIWNESEQNMINQINA